MMRLNNEELKNINGGSLSASMLSAFARSLEIVWDIARSLGTSIRMLVENKSCSL